MLLLFFGMSSTVLLSGRGLAATELGGRVLTPARAGGHAARQHEHRLGAGVDAVGIARERAPRVDVRGGALSVSQRGTHSGTDTFISLEYVQKVKDS